MLTVKRLYSCLSKAVLDSNFTTKSVNKCLSSLENAYRWRSAEFCSGSLEDKTKKSKDEEFNGIIPIEDLQISYSRSSGPGGQNVNKVNSKVEIRFHVCSAKWIPDWIKPQLMEKESGRITKDGYMVMTSEKTRKQLLNQADCLAKLRTLIWESSVKPHEPTAEELEKVQQRENREKVKVYRIKKHHSLKKFNRQAPSGDF